MACGGCRKRQQNKNVQIRRPIMTTAISGKNVCPICRHAMRSLHKFDKSVKKIVRSWYCTKPSCPNSRGTI